MTAFANLQSFFKIFFINLVVSILYLISGKLSLQLSSIDGYSVPVWPPAGIALGFAIIFGKKIWPGLFLGALLTNSNDLLTQSNVISYLLKNFQNITIAFGNSLGGIFGSFIIKKYSDNRFKFYYTKQILLFFILAGPVSSLITSTIGVISLYVGKIIYLQFVLKSWITWWIGDSIGIIIFAPLIVVTWNWVRKEEEYLRVVILTLTTMGTFLVTIAIFFLIRNWEKSFLNYRIQSDGIKISKSLEIRLLENFGIVKSLKNFISIEENLTKKKFEQFALDSIKQSSSILALSWNPYIRHSERNTHEINLKNDYPDSIGIKELLDNKFIKALNQEDYIYVKYIVPYEENKNAIGFNVWSNEIRKKALIISKQKNDIEVTNKIKLVQLRERNIGVLVFNYTKTNKGNEGFCTAVIHIPTILEKVMNELEQANLCIKLIDESNLNDPILSSKGCDLQKENIFQKFTYTNKFLIGSMQWSIVIKPTNEYFSKNLSNSSTLILIIASFLTGLASMLTLIITGREKNINEVVKQRTLELEKANLVKSEFLANMSHEIRTPMNGVLGMLTLLESTPLNEEQKDHLNDAKNSVLALLTIINDILDVSKLESKKLEIHPVNTNLTRLCREIMHLFKLEAAKKNLTLNFEIFESDKDIFVLVDENRLRQILMNLIGNAIKFTLHGSVQFIVKSDTKKEFLIFYVRDTGIGISEENSKKLFERFVQLEDARTKKFIGSGLGLFITKQLVNLMGGNIYLESKENIGSNFYFTIPYKRREAEMINSEISSSPATKLKREFYILVAEDNLINQKLIKKILEKENIQFSLATNGLKVLELLDQSTDSANKKFDLILMDIQMPEMDGITATKLIRNRNDLYKNIPIIATTANGMDSQIEEYLKNGITSCITKPIIFKQLIDEIDRLIP